MQNLRRQGAKILDQKPVPAGRDYAAAWLMAGKLHLLDNEGLVARVHKALGSGGPGKASANDYDVVFGLKRHGLTNLRDKDHGH